MIIFETLMMPDIQFARCPRHRCPCQWSVVSMLNPVGANLAIVPITDPALTSAIEMIKGDNQSVHLIYRSGDFTDRTSLRSASMRADFCDHERYRFSRDERRAWLGN